MENKRNIVDKLFVRHYNKKISSLGKKDDIYDVNQKIKNEKTLSNFAHKSIGQIENLKIKLLGNESEVDKKIRAKIDAFDHKQYWEIRKEAHSYTQKLFELQKSGELTAEKRAELKALHDEANEKLENKRAQHIAFWTSKKPSMLKAGEGDREASQEVIEKIESEKRAEALSLQKSLDEERMKNVSALREKCDAKIAVLEQKLLKHADTQSHEMANDTILKVSDLSMRFGGLKAVDDLSFEVKKGEIFGLIGPNGAGKTTVFNCITQFYKPTEGEILYRAPKGNIMSLTEEKVHDVIKYGIVRTFQNVEVVWELSILENLLVAAHSKYDSNLFTQMLALPSLKKEDAALRAKAVRILQFLGLEQIKDVIPWGLPYGTLKKIELARTLMCDPKLIILDEPAAGLNDKETEDLAETIEMIRKEYNTTIFLVEHDMGLVMNICDHILAISFGKKLAYGTAKEIQSDKAVKEAYLGGE